MTTILIDYENQTVYADKQCTYKTSSGMKVSQDKDDRKLSQLYLDENSKVRSIFAFSGNVDVCIQFKSEYVCGTLTDVMDFGDADTRILVIHRNDKGLRVDCYTSKPLPRRLWRIRKWKWQCETVTQERGYRAIGSGSQYILGAVKANGDPEEAFKITSLLDDYTNCFDDGPDSIYLGVNK